MTELSTCRECRVTKPVSEFHKWRDSHHLDCAVCRNAKRRAQSAARRPDLAAKRAERDALLAAGKKRCKDCHEVLPASEFYGKQTDCKRCLGRRVAAYKLEHPEASAESKRRSYLKVRETEEYKVRRREDAKRYAENHPDEVNARQRAYIESGRSKERARERYWRKPSIERNADGRELQRQTEPAPRIRHEWASWELELAADHSRTSHEVARLTGRTYYAVRHMRWMVRHDPKTIRRAGIADSGRL